MKTSFLSLLTLWILVPLITSCAGKPTSTGREFGSELTQALAQAQKNQQLLFVDFAASWCPPCIRLEHEVFPTAAFQSATKDYVLVRVDVDREENYQWTQKYSVKAFPTMIVLDSNGQEIARYLDYMKADLLAAKLTDVQKNRPAPLGDVQMKAQHGDKIKAAEYADTLYKSMQFAPAIEWYEKAGVKSQKYYDAAISLRQRQLAEESSPQTKVELQKALERGIAAFPESFYSIQWRLDLAQTDLPAAKKKQVLSEGLELDRKWLKEPARIQAALNNGDLIELDDLVVPELWSSQAELLEQLGQKDKALEAWNKAVDTTLSLHPDATRPTVVIYLIHYMKHARSLEEIEPWLVKLEMAYPTQFTYFHRHAQLLLEKKEPTRALPVAEKSYELSYGGNHLQAGLLLAKVKKALNQKTEAKTLLNELLSQKLTQAPENKRVAKSIKSFLEEVEK